MSLLAISTVRNEDFCQKFNKCMDFPKLKGKFSITQFFMKTQAYFCQNTSKNNKNSIYKNASYVRFRENN